MSNPQRTNLGTLLAVGLGSPVRAPQGDHTFTLTVSGSGAVSASVAIMGSNDLLGWVQIASLNASGTGVGSGSASITSSYAYWRADASALAAGAVASVVAATEEGQGSQSPVSGGGIRDEADLRKAAADLYNADTIKQLFINPGVEIIPSSPLAINLATTPIKGQFAKLNLGNFTGATKGLTVGFNFPDYNGWRRYANIAPIEDLYIIGPGFNPSSNVGSGACTAAIYTQGIVGAPANRAVRPKLSNVFITGFDVAYEMGDVSFLGSLRDVTIHDCGAAIVQRNAVDSGEMVMLNNVLIQRTRLAFLDQSSHGEFAWQSGSWDYDGQLCVLMPSGGSSPWSHLTLGDIHKETRGTYDGSDEVAYPTDGSGSDPRALIFGRDSVVDIDGSGSFVLDRGGLFDFNTNGLIPANVLPWASFKNIVKTRHKNSAFIAHYWSPQTLMNSNQLLHDGFGHCEVKISRLIAPGNYTLPARKSNNPLHKALKHGHFPTAQIEDCWTVSRDTAQITNRWTGANISMARDSSVTRAESIAPALTLSGTATGVQTVTSQVDAFSPDMVGKNLVVGSGVAQVTSVDSHKQMTLNVTAAFASTAIAANTAVVRTTASLKVTKVGAAGSVAEVSVLIDAKPGDIFTGRIWHWIKASGGTSGTPSIKAYWAKKGMPRVLQPAIAATPSTAQMLQAVPTLGYDGGGSGSDWNIGAAREANPIRQFDLQVTSTNVWTENLLVVPNDTAAGYGSMQCPDHMDIFLLTVSMNAANAGDLNLEFDISRWG